ncbi:histidine--tRNA ligase [Terribacillus saccharophilus]|uniref:Histidine--tRNA ligase n=1 Tax=Terribacillus saccharophilus TaxID=361277 RepID=A0ABX4H1G5_9BACI|nr:histidine--tRNA ligase [Terribacillus saccharophilus]PAD36570.1 histidine--tRNA ligase [Terribacillus saccharophilus]PAD97226.1 histidine--tRNA ligase [Terribacillus saccharophilus]PAE00981.1 histidine--tRNA ligase [Terribacillus saccharophilus]
MEMKAPRGTQDILPGTSEKWQYVEKVLTDLASKFNYKEIRVPIFEHTELFLRGVGETTDIVQKEMYTFKDKGDRSLTLRPEGTASVVRAYVQNKLYGLPEQPTKLFYYGPMFRYERPQQGRMRQFVQFGVEALGSEDPAIDAEVISLAMSGYQQLGLKSLKLIINTLGDKESREAHRTALIEHFTPVKDELCSDCQNRLEKNPLRILDCKKDREHPKVKSAPSIHDYLNDESKAYFDGVKANLDAIGIPYEVDPNLVRGLDYYNHTAFEIMSNAEGFGALTTLTGGGRYNGLVEEIGGPSTPGIGYALSIERLLFALEAEGIELPVEAGTDVYVVALSDEAVQKEAAKLTYQLRLAGVTADKDYLGKKMKGQFKAADRQQAKFVVVLGEDELEKGVISLRNMQDGQQNEVAIKEAVDTIKQQLDGGKADE